MELLIFSDSHGDISRMRAAFVRQVRRPDAVIFLGDGLRDVESLDWDPAILYSVAGNCDWFADGVRTEIVMALEGHTLLMTHGHLYGVKGGYGPLLKHAAEVGADIVLCGHTHLPCEETIPAGTQLGNVILERPMYLLNPGSIGKGGSFGTLSLQKDRVLPAHGSV